MWVIGTAHDRRIELLQAARKRHNLAPAQLLSYADLLHGRAVSMPRGAVVRIESPGKDENLYRQLVAYGSGTTPNAWPSETGRYYGGAAWYAGFKRLLEELEQQGQQQEWRLLNPPADILLMFNKQACHGYLAQAGIRVPHSIPGVSSYVSLISALQAARVQRVFIKPAYGSSGAGIIAYARQGSREQAISTLEIDAGVLYVTRRMRTYTDQRSIETIIDHVCADGAHIEVWVPKAGQGNHCFDVRVVVIAGQAQHIVVRKSRSPITNLHLLNPRGEVEWAQNIVGPAAWAAGLASCEQVMACFPRSLYAGIDLAWSPWGDHAILEVNAFGDLLPGIFNAQGDDTYGAEWRAFQHGFLDRSL